MTTLHVESQYYLHSNGSVIYKPHGGVDGSSDFVKKVWNANTIGESPGTFLKWLMELADLGANTARIEELWHSNKLTDHVGEDVAKIFFQKLH